MHVRASTSSTLTRHCHTIGIPSKGCNVGLDPFKCFDLIQKSIVARSYTVLCAGKYIVLALK